MLAFMKMEIGIGLLNTLSARNTGQNRAYLSFALKILIFSILQVQYHTERDAASCEALRDLSLHALTNSKISLPRATTLPLSLKSITTEGADVSEVEIDEDGISTTALWHCRSSAGSAPALFCSPNSTIHDCKSATYVKNKTVRRSSSSSSSL